MTDYTDRNRDLESETPRPASVSFSASAAPVPTVPAFDADKYREHLKPFDLTEAQERELLETLWSIMVGFVELGFTVDVCAAVFDAPEIVADDRAGVVDSLSSPFSEASNNSAEEGPA